MTKEQIARAAVIPGHRTRTLDAATITAHASMTIEQHTHTAAQVIVRLHGKIPATTLAAAQAMTQGSGRTGMIHVSGKTVMILEHVHHQAASGVKQSGMIGDASIAVDGMLFFRQLSRLTFGSSQGTYDFPREHSSKQIFEVAALQYTQF